jgi:hypothetical protein
MSNDRLPWRVGRKVGRTIYQQVGPEPSDDDVLIGFMDTPELAWQAVAAHNFRIGIGASAWRTLMTTTGDDEGGPR